MKYIKQFSIILLISFLGEALHALLPLPIPASIYGIVLLFAGAENHPGQRCKGREHISAGDHAHAVHSRCGGAAGGLGHPGAQPGGLHRHYAGNDRGGHGGIGLSDAVSCEKGKEKWVRCL